MSVEPLMAAANPLPKPASLAWSSLLDLAAQARTRLPWLWWGGWLALALSVLFLVLQWQDQRLLQGVSVWTKPWKFHVSVGLHMLTLAWFAALLADTPQRRRAFNAMSAVVLLSAVFELAYITWRAARGEPSHFNVGTAFGSVMYSLMGLGAVLMTAGAGWLGWHILRARDFAWDPVLQRGVGIGLLLGWLLGTLSGAYVSSQTGHGVGGTLGDAAGLPIVRWATDGGDLRVAHFFGLHAMQLLPLMAWLFARIGAPAAALSQVYAVALVYSAFTAFTFVQALLGRPFI